ncbi:MAG: African swine fever virus, partial [Pseudomonadota bacterium]
LINPNAYQSSESAIAYLNEDLLGSPTRPGGLDKVLLPHMGQSWESRTRKLRYLGLLIHKLLLVHLGALPPTDRDSYRNKRVHGAGVSLAKAFKTQVNNSIVIPITRAIRRELKNNPWETITEGSLVDTFRNAVSTSDLNRAMEQAITAGNKTIVVRRRAATNRVSSQALERKNGLNTFSALRTVVTQNAGNASKQTERADMMRRVHPTYLGFICVAQSADTGENVGMRKQLAITAGVCTAGEALPLKLRLLADAVVTPLDRVDSAAMLRRRLARVFVNGEWIGCADSAHELVARYRALRREGRAVDPSTTIAHDPVTDEVEFWLDVGRLRRPLLIVDNNIAEYDAALRARFAWASADPATRGKEPAAVEFVQNVRYTPEHARAIVAGRLTLADLLREGVLEYITPEEQENCLIAESIMTLRAVRTDVTRQFTHCDVEQAIFGLAAHVSPYGHHTQPTRVTYETNHARQTGGWYALNFPYRTDKNRFFQFYNEIPLVRTIAHQLIPANGNNVIIAYMSYGGDNQEDSAIVNQASTDRGLFAGAFFRYELAELEKGESFACPDRLTTKNLKPNANYEKLNDGFIRRGSTVQYGDVLIGRIARLSRTGAAASSAEYQFTDRSIVYRLHEPAIVEDVLQPRGANDELFGVVKLRYERPLRTGDKLSSRAGNKSIVASVLQQSDMPFTERGVTPDLIINTNSIPSRQIIGQLIETTRGVSCARRGAITDGTSFLPVDHRANAAELVELGYRYNGRERLYNGMTGEYFDAAIVIGPCAEQRLQKFVLDDEQSVAGSGPTDATTGQPLGGKHVHGGLRIGEMEHWGLESHGSMYNLFEKTSQDSDGRVMHICRGCSALAAYNEFQGVYNCKSCGELADISAVDGSKSAILFHEELAAANITVRLGLRPRAYEEIGSEAASTHVDAASNP